MRGPVRQVGPGPGMQAERAPDADLAAPGRDQALARGCRCPTLPNSLELIRRRGPLVAPDCPLQALAEP